MCCRGFLSSFIITVCEGFLYIVRSHHHHHYYHPPASDLKDLYVRAVQADITAELHQQLVERAKRFTQRIFGVQNKLLQDMKKAKQEYLKNKI